MEQNNTNKFNEQQQKDPNFLKKFYESKKRYIRIINKISFLEGEIKKELEKLGVFRLDKKKLSYVETRELLLYYFITHDEFAEIYREKEKFREIYEKGENIYNIINNKKKFMQGQPQLGIIFEIIKEIIAVIRYGPEVSEAIMLNMNPTKYKYGSLMGSDKLLSQSFPPPGEDLPCKFELDLDQDTRYNISENKNRKKLEGIIWDKKGYISRLKRVLYLLFKGNKDNSSDMPTLINQEISAIEEDIKKIEEDMKECGLNVNNIRLQVDKVIAYDENILKKTRNKIMGISDDGFGQNVPNDKVKYPNFDDNNPNNIIGDFNQNQITSKKIAYHRQFNVNTGMNKNINDNQQKKFNMQNQNQKHINIKNNNMQMVNIISRMNNFGNMMPKNNMLNRQMADDMRLRGNGIKNNNINIMMNNQNQINNNNDINRKNTKGHGVNWKAVINYIKIYQSVIGNSQQKLDTDNELLEYDRLAKNTLEITIPKEIEKIKNVIYELAFILCGDKDEFSSDSQKAIIKCIKDKKDNRFDVDDINVFDLAKQFTLFLEVKNREVCFKEIYGDKIDDQKFITLSEAVKKSFEGRFLYILMDIKDKMKKTTNCNALIKRGLKFFHEKLVFIEKYTHTEKKMKGLFDFEKDKKKVDTLVEQFKALILFIEKSGLFNQVDIKGFNQIKKLLNMILNLSKLINNSDLEQRKNLCTAIIYSGGIETKFKIVARNNLFEIAKIIEPKLVKLGVDFNKKHFS